MYCRSAKFKHALFNDDAHSVRPQPNGFSVNFFRSKHLMKTENMIGITNTTWMYYIYKNIMLNSVAVG